MTAFDLVVYKLVHSSWFPALWYLQCHVKVLCNKLHILPPRPTPVFSDT